MSTPFIKKIREEANLRLYKSKAKADKIYENMSFFMVIAGLFSFLQYHGFPQDNIITKVISYSFGTLILIQLIKFSVGLVYHFNPREYIRENRIEAIILLIALIHSILFFIGMRIEFLHELIDHYGDSDLEFAFLSQVYFLFIFLIEIGRVSSKMPTVNLSPPALLLTSFVILIFSGALLLMLPKMTVMEGSMPFMEALFTSTSASCVTGLAVVDTATYFTAKGQFVIMLLIQLGGLNIISFALLFAFLTNRSVGIKQQSMIRDNFEIGNIKESKKLLRKVFLFSFTIEVIGSIMLFIAWGNSTEFKNLGEKIFKSVFHSISAFNNAGFSTFTNGLYEDFLKGHILMQMSIAVLIILGSTGFTVIHEIFNMSNIKKFFRREKIRYSLNTKFGLYTPLILLVFGSLSFFFLEYDNTLKDMSFVEALSNSFFQSVTTRTAGFNTVDIGDVGMPMILLMMMLMYIGANPVSTGGGVKTNTFALLFIAAWNTIRGKKDIEISKNRISFKSLNKALIVLIFSISIIFISTVLLSITENDKEIIDLIFEEISAFATVGLSRGITSDLTQFGRIIIILSMFLGRIGLLTLVYSLGITEKQSKYQYPKAKIIIG